MNYYTEFEALESLLDSDGYESVFEMDESDESDESDEARRSRQRRRAGARPRVPSGQGLYKARPTGTYVTQVQLKSAMDRVGAQIKTNADATKAVNTRVNVVNDRVDKEAAIRKKENAELNKKIKKGQEASLLPLLLQKAPETETKTITATVGGVPDQSIDVVTKVKQPSDNLLPLLLIMGMGGGGSGSDDSSMGLMAIALLGR